MVAMAVGDKHIVHSAEINAHLPGITDKQVAGSRIEQDAVTLRFQEYRQPMLGCQLWVVGAIIYEYGPLHHSDYFVVQYPNATAAIPNATLPIIYNAKSA